MKKLTLLLSILFCILSCTKEEIIEYNSSLDEWRILKKQNGNSYIYTTSTQSWVGIETNTTLTIQNDIVISRAFEAYEIDYTSGNKIVMDSYIETSEDLNTHESGFSTLTIDELYSSCIEDYLSVKKKDNAIYFETNDIGIISKCGFVPDNCADDCFRGFNISSFEWL